MMILVSDEQIKHSQSLYDRVKALEKEVKEIEKRAEALKKDYAEDYWKAYEVLRKARVTSIGIDEALEKIRAIEKKFDLEQEIYLKRMELNKARSALEIFNKPFVIKMREHVYAEADELQKRRTLTKVKELKNALTDKVEVVFRTNFEQIKQAQEMLRSSIGAESNPLSEIVKGYKSAFAQLEQVVFTEGELQTVSKGRYLEMVQNLPSNISIDESKAIVMWPAEVKKATDQQAKIDELGRLANFAKKQNE